MLIFIHKQNKFVKIVLIIVYPAILIQKVSRFYVINVNLVIII